MLEIRLSKRKPELVKKPLEVKINNYSCLNAFKDLKAIDTDNVVNVFIIILDVVLVYILDHVFCFLWELFYILSDLNYSYSINRGYKELIKNHNFVRKYNDEQLMEMALSVDKYDSYRQVKKKILEKYQRHLSKNMAYKVLEVRRNFPA